MIDTLTGNEGHCGQRGKRSRGGQGSGQARELSRPLARFQLSLGNGIRGEFLADMSDAAFKRSA